MSFKNGKESQLLYKTNGLKEEPLRWLEKTLPVLQAAHIKPYSEDGPHAVRNGLLLKSDFHTLYDDGYITIDTDYRINVSKQLHDDYGNGKDYYKYDGKRLLILPEKEIEMPSKDFLEWHNENVYLG